MSDTRELKDEAARAMGRSQWPAALRLYAQLADAEPQDGTWPLRAGDAARRLGQHREAITWYERAAFAYAQRGFVVRAVAVGKMVKALDPGNDRVLRAIDSVEQRPAAKLIPPPPRSATPPPPPGRPPLSGRLTGPSLEASVVQGRSVEIVFDSMDDGIPIGDQDILSMEAAALTGAPQCDDAQAARLVERFADFPLFDVLPSGAFMEVISRMQRRTFVDGQIVVRQGEQGTSLFAIAEGRAVVYLEGCRDKPLATLEPGAIFGEMALVLDQPRGATVEAAGDLELLEMDRDLLRSVLESHPGFGDLLSRLIKRRLVENVIRTAPLFQPLEPPLRRELMRHFEVREMCPGTKVVAQGTLPDGLYMVLVGEVRATLRCEGPEKVVATLGPGQVFGALSLIDASHRSATDIEAHRETLALRLPRSAFNEVVSTYPPVLEMLAEVASAQEAWECPGQVPVV